ncbi:neutral zinc metallopeptidase [Microlunatus parietis]|uniref:Neutral zinc metallopeptidase n=1 Tax=Microlunatus parietis TaxID=682979 RepID=A0A7Y9IAE9_9ACTN|nr:neutral zinc metallopeptidase [Microlunatus parietis]NYE73060.1 hypothetical protein [Microlunatus parietis]
MNQPSGPPGWPAAGRPAWGPPAEPAAGAGGPGARYPPPLPPPPPEPPRRGGLIAALVIAIFVLLIGTIVVTSGVISAIRDVAGDLGQVPTASPRPRPTLTKPTPTRPTPEQPQTSRPEPTPAPSRPTSTPKGPDTGLIKNALYDLELERGDGDCDIEVRRPKPPLKDSRLKPYLEDVVDCMVKLYRKPLDKIGFDLSTPKIKTYGGTVRSPCGRLDQNGSPAYYCSADKTIYWPETSDDDREAYTFARLGYVGLLAHEFGHHLQAEAGMFREYSYAWAEASNAKQLELSRRLELQAQCFEGVFLSYASDSIDFSADDLYEIREWHSYTGDEDPPESRIADHGTSRAQIRWLERGYDSTDFGRCNTWKASTKSVK